MYSRIIDHIKGNKTLLNGSLFSLYSFFSQGVNFVLLIILAKFISPSEYGNLSLFSTIIEILGILFGLSSSGYISVAYFRETHEDFKKDFSVIFNLHIISLLVYFLLLFIGGHHISKILALPLDILYMAGFIVLFNKCYFVYLNIHRLKEKIKIYGVISCSNALFNFVLALFFVVYLNLNWLGRIYSMVACTSLFAIISIVFFFKEGLFSFQNIREKYWPVILWSLPLIPHLAANWIKQGLDRYIINYSYSSFEVGIFSFALNLTSVIISVGVAFNESNSVALFKTLSSSMPCDNKIRVIKHSIKEYLLIYLVLSLAIVVCGAVFTPFFFPQYSNSVPYFVILGIYGFFQCVYFLFCNFFFYYKRNKNLMYVTFGTSVIHLLLSIVLTRYSLFYTAMIYLLSMLIVDIFVIYLGRRMVKENLLFAK